MATLRQRFFNAEPIRPEDDLVLGIGSIRDYYSLASHHYKAAAPATIARVLVLRNQKLGAVNKYTDKAGKNQTVGVLVESMPVLHCGVRNWALHGRYNGFGAKQLGMLLKEELRCISRVVVHPQWRGLGLAVRLVRTALDHPTTHFTESLAAMGHIHPFFERAGMAAYRRHPHRGETRLIEAFESVGIGEKELVSIDVTQQRIDSLSNVKNQWILKELQRWYRTVIRHRGGCCNDPSAQLRLAQQRLFCQPVYYLKDNRSCLENMKSME